MMSVLIRCLAPEHSYSRSPIASEEKCVTPERAVDSGHHTFLDTEREEVVPSATIRSDREP
jgi:hypothetical protein